jgi:hypothetical protein
MYHDDAGCKQASCGCIKTAKDLRGETRIPPFRSIRRITEWLVKFAIASIILTIISVAVTVVYFAVTYPLEGDSVSDNISSIIDSLNLIISVVAIIIMLFWYYRTSKNIHSFGAKQVWRPILSVIWWFIPLINLYMPYDVTQQFWKVSNPQTKLVNGTEWKKTPRSDMIIIWWVLIVASIVGVFVFGFGLGLHLVLNYGNVNPEESPEPFLESNETTLFLIIMSIIFPIMTIISLIYFIKIIKQISIWQELKHSNLSTSTSS